MTLRHWLDTLIQDSTFGLRSIRQGPLVAAATVVTLTLGIGLSAGIFSFINAIWLRPPVAKDPGSFVRLYIYNSQPSFNFGQPGSISLRTIGSMKPLIPLANSPPGIRCVRSSGSRTRSPYGPYWFRATSSLYMD